MSFLIIFTRFEDQLRNPVMMSSFTTKFVISNNMGNERSNVSKLKLIFYIYLG